MSYIGFPGIIGVILLALSVVFLDPTSQNAIPGAQFGFQAARVLPIALIGYIILVIFSLSISGFILGYFVSLNFPLLTPQKHLPSHVPPLQVRWKYLPGGEEYALYRKQRQAGRGGEITGSLICASHSASVAA